MTNDTNKKRTLATGALALGLTGGIAASRSEREIALQPNQVLIFAYDYQPTLSFQAVNQLQQGTVDSILGGDPGLVSDPADYNGYVVVYRPGGDAQGEYTLAFVREDVLQTGTQYNFTGSVSFFNTQANLLQAGVAEGGGGGTTTPTEEDGTTTTTTEEDGTTTTTTEEEGTTTTTTTTADNETTTEEVVVDTTTPENGG